MFKSKKKIILSGICILLIVMAAVFFRPRPLAKLLPENMSVYITRSEFIYDIDSSGNVTPGSETESCFFESTSADAENIRRILSNYHYHRELFHLKNNHSEKNGDILFLLNICSPDAAISDENLSGDISLSRPKDNCVILSLSAFNGNSQLYINDQCYSLDYFGNENMQNLLSELDNCIAS